MSLLDIFVEAIKKCEHTTDADTPHECPYQAELYGDDAFRCMCCDECTYECYMET